MPKTRVRYEPPSCWSPARYHWARDMLEAELVSSRHDYNTIPDFATFDVRQLDNLSHRSSDSIVLVLSNVHTPCPVISLTLRAKKTKCQSRCNDLRSERVGVGGDGFSVNK